MISFPEAQKIETTEGEPHQNRSLLSDGVTRRPANNYWSSLDLRSPFTSQSRVPEGLAPPSNHRSPWYA